MFLHNNGSKLDFWKIASDDKNYMIEDIGNFINISDVNQILHLFSSMHFFRQMYRFRDFELF